MGIEKMDRYVVVHSPMGSNSIVIGDRKTKKELHFKKRDAKIKEYPHLLKIFANGIEQIDVDVIEVKNEI